MFRALMHNHSGTDIPLDLLKGRDIYGRDYNISVHLDAMGVREPQHW